MKKQSANRPLRFERRDLLKTLTAVPSAILVSGGLGERCLAQGMSQPSASQNAGGVYQPRVLDPHEWKTVTILCEWIIPADARSMSAREAGVPEFIDDWLAFKGGDLVAEIRGGLTWLDIECQRSFGLDFADCAVSQQREILDRIAYPRKSAPEVAAAVAFFNRLRDLVISGFYTSRAGVRDLPYIGNEPQSGWNGCPVAALAQLGVYKSSTPP